jgi:hypothetical protein
MKKIILTTPPFGHPFNKLKRNVVAFCFLLSAFCLLPSGLIAQPLLDIYKKGTVKLVPDTEFAQGNDWEKVFVSYYDTLYNAPMGDRKTIVVTPTGSTVVSNRHRDFYTMFDANGKFVKEFSIKDKSGKIVKEPEAILGVINNHFFTGLDKMGIMYIVDFNGNFVKTLKLDYAAREIIPIGNNKLALVGWVLWKDKDRHFVAIIDYETNAEKIIWDYFEPRSTGTLNLEKNDKGEIVRLKTNEPNDNIRFARPSIAFINNQLLIALPHSGELLFYDVNGNLKSKDKLGWEQKYLSVAEQKEMHRKSMEKFNTEERQKMLKWGMTNKFVDEWIAEMNENAAKINKPKPLPMFSNIIKDSDGNLLFFEMPETEGGNKFNVWVYQDGGKFVCQSSFVCDDFDLVISPSKMVFHKGYIYALQTLKNAKGNPLRLVRFKVGN